MKTYTSKPDEDLGAIAAKFGLPSWKYLYQLNKDKIGDNPDLLKEGTVLKIPQWDSTGGDEKIEAKGVSASDYTGGLRYRYPWAPASITLTDTDKATIRDFAEPRELIIRSRATGLTIFTGSISRHDELETLVPGGVGHVQIGIKGLPLLIAGKMHYHPDDDPRP